MKTRSAGILFVMLSSASSMSRAADPQPTPTLETATLAAGCFWGTEEFFRKVPGVVETKVGYTGGHLANPTYEDTSSGSSGHAESLELEFTP